MNAVRRKKLEDIITRLEELQGELNCIMEEEEDSRDRMIEGTENYETSEESSSDMEDADSSIGDAIGSLYNITC